MNKQTTAPKLINFPKRVLDFMFNDKPNKLKRIQNFILRYMPQTSEQLLDKVVSCMPQPIQNFMLNNKPKQILDELSKLEKNYTIVANINLETTAIITFKDLLPEALQYYTKIKQITPPTFILADLNTDLTQDDSIRKLIADYRVIVVSIGHIAQIPQKLFCLYGRTEMEYFNGPYGIQALIDVCAENNIKNGFFVDVSVFDKLYLLVPLIDYTKHRMQAVIKIYEALKDDLSREYFLRAIKFLATGETGYLKTSPYPQYEHPTVKAENGDYIIEGGLDTGATTIRFLEQIGTNGHIYAFEPLNNAYNATKELASQYNNATIEHYGLYSKSMKFYIEDSGSSSFLISKPTVNSEECQCTSIDSYVSANKIKCNLIKLDIEGAEIECLIGAEKTINEFYPKLQISIYHQPQHYLDIPLMILDKYPNYQLYIGHHSFWPNETVLYAIKK